jgi:stage V sporulation protein D (sporulation-specific penicillin-binding protein)
MKHPRRFSLLMLGFYAGFVLIVGRLFYWQVIQSDNLQAVASDQYQKSLAVKGSRGRIFTTDNKLLVGNEEVYRLFVEPPLLTNSPQDLAGQIVPSLGEELRTITNASSTVELNDIISQEKERISNRLNDKKDSSWVGLYGKISHQSKEKLEELNLPGIGFEPYEVRLYPEASMAAHVTGFLGKNEAGDDVGYFGIEGSLEKELQPRTSVQKWVRGLLGFTQQEQDHYPLDGRDVYLTIRRDIQYLAEDHLKQAMERYGAKSGEVLIMEPSTGAILASASFPSYDQKKFFEYDQSLYKNPIVTHLFEPGSTFKTITVASGIESGAITPDTMCDRCSEPLQMGKYTIKTWNNEYHPNISMTEALAKSDNVAMVFAQQQMGKDAFIETIKKFGFGEATGAELQEDTNPPFPQKLGPVELATISFGQGISTNSLQLTRAIAAIANGGKLMQPMFIAKVVDHTTSEEIVSKPRQVGQPISAQTAEQVTKMMIEAAEHGEAQWTASPDHTIAGKTGTAQIAENGAYNPNKTIASFIGFSPAQNPKFVMLVKLVEPQSSPWAAETAAPLWYNIAEELNWLLQIPPDK